MLYDIPHIESRSVNAENPTGGRASGGFAGGGRKGAPCLGPIAPGETVTLMDVQGCGTIRHIWMTFPPKLQELLRCLVIRMYWDGQETPSVEVPIGDFFGIAHARFRPMASQLTAFQGGKGLNCWIPMPFCKSARITVENDSDVELPMLFYQIDFTLGDRHSEDMGWFHAQFRRENCLPYGEDYVILDGVKGRGRFLGMVLGVRSVCFPESWWGEGEVKMYFDGESQPTICGTGTEDYMGMAWGLSENCTPLQGCPLCDDKNGLYSIYRWHVPDPVCFEQSLRVTIQQIGCGEESKVRPVLGERFVRYPAAGVPVDDDICYYERSDDYCSVAYWYQTLPTVPFPKLPSREERLADLMLDRDEGTVKRDDIE